MDPKAYPAGEIAELYHERWELELGYDELKTDVLEQQEAIRSETPDGVRQELWGMAIAYNLVRREMDLAAREMGIYPSHGDYCRWHPASIARAPDPESVACNQDR